MASTPVILLLKRTGNSSDRPNTATVQAGEAALSFGGADPGLYFKDSAGAIRKLGPNHYGSTAPNSSPVGSTGNSVGELWVEAAGSYYMRVWTGSAWQKVGAGFADQATSANTANTANSATTAGTADTATVANSAIVASGSFEANLASGIAVVTTLPPAYAGGVVYLNSGASGLYVSANGGWILT
tara:strand:- start:434 stop:988 length:555 start_codon:yes stop_codon:yes gene_type:complete